MTGRAAELLQPWAGLVIGVLAGALSHQIGADSLFNNCQRFAPAPVLIESGLCLIASVIGGLASLPVLRSSGQQTTPRVVAAISVGFASLVALAILLPMLGAMILPPCFQ